MQKKSNWGHIDGKVRYSNHYSIRTIRNTRIIRVFFQKVFYILASTIPTRIGNPIYVYKQSGKWTLYLVTTVWKSCSAAVLLFIHTKSFLAFYLNT